MSKWPAAGQGFKINSFVSFTVDEENETFTLKDIKEKIKFGDDKSWNPFFKDGVESIKVEQIEKYLTSCAAKEDIRYDFTFFTPSFRDVRVKVFYSCCIFWVLIITITILFVIQNNRKTAALTDLLTVTNTMPHLLQYRKFSYNYTYITYETNATIF